MKKVFTILLLFASMLVGAQIPGIGSYAPPVSQAATGFITEWNLTAGSFTLPLSSSFSYDMTVDWGDGSAISTVTAYNDVDATHNYSSSGTYQITINGICGGIRAGSTDFTDYLKLTKIIQWGEVQFSASAFYGAFLNCSNMVSIPDGPLPNYSTYTNLGNLFNGTSISYIPPDLFSGVSVQSGISINNAFDGTLCSIIPSGLLDPLGDNIAFARYSFRNMPNLTTIPADLFDMAPSISNFSYCFQNNNAITSNVPDLWNSHPTATSTSCFYGCTSAANYASIPAAWK